MAEEVYRCSLAPEWSGVPCSTPSDVSSCGSSSCSVRSDATSCYSSSTTLTIPDGGLKPPDRIKRVTRGPRSLGNDCKAGFEQQTSSHRLEGTPSYVSSMGATFNSIPEEVLDCIVTNLSMLRPEKEHRATMKDLCNLSFVSLKWHKSANRQLYRTIWIPAAALRSVSRRFLRRHKSRLQLLQRTLLEVPEMCHFVRQICITDQIPGQSISRKEAKECTNQLASIISSCPAFESLVGYDWIFTHDQHPMFQALATREKLKEHKLNIGSFKRTRAASKLSFRSSTVRGSLEEDHTLSIVRFCAKSKNLESLSISCTQSGVLHERFWNIFEHSRMPALRKLELSHIAAQDFEIRHLHLIPHTIQTLRLESLPGISECDLVDYFTNHLPLFERQFLRDLELINIQMHSISSLAAILDHLYNLERLSIVTSGLHLDEDTNPDEILYPFISSKSLSYLHWEQRAPNDYTDVANYCEQASSLTDTILAESIIANGFPSLSSICAPLDTHGIIQSVCKPISIPLVQGAAFSGSLKSNNSYSALNACRLQNTHRSLFGFATCNNSDSTPSKNNLELRETIVMEQAAAAYRRAAAALFPRRRMGRDAELGFKFSLLEEVDPFITLYVEDEQGDTRGVFDFPQFLGRVGPGVPTYELPHERTRL